MLNVEDTSVMDRDFKDFINENSLTIVSAYVEPSLQNAKLNNKYQFIRNGYYVLDSESTSDNLIFNKTVGLKDSFKG